MGSGCKLLVLALPVVVLELIRVGSEYFHWSSEVGFGPVEQEGSCKRGMVGRVWSQIRWELEGL